jgi:peptidoglycan/xylan/chitin deacetylase (PgdA/CDA1 family)
METHDVVPLQEALEPSRGMRRRPRAAITFDDAYVGAVTSGVDELTRRSLPATIFVAPAFLDGGSFWWDQLTQPGAPLADDVREIALSQLRGDSNAITVWAEREGLTVRRLPPYAVCASQEVLHAAAARPGISIGSHTWHHLNLTRLGSEHLAEELTRPIAWLRERFDSFVPFVSYPYGLSTPAVEAAAAAAGYAAAFRVTGGWLRSGTMSRFAVPRFNVPSGMSRRSFALRTDGMFCP